MFTNIRFFMLLSLSAVSLGLAACNTIQGAGHDIEHAGKVVQDAAK